MNLMIQWSVREEQFQIHLVLCMCYFIKERNNNMNLTVLSVINNCKKTLLGDILINYFEIIYYFFFEEKAQNCNEGAAGGICCS